MDTTEQVTKWVESKLENIIKKDLEEKITEESQTFDIETYANNLFDKYFNENNVKNLKEILNTEYYYDLLYNDSENSTGEQNTHDSLESESNELNCFSVDVILWNLESGSEEVRKKSLKVLEACVEDLIGQPFWNKLNEILQKMLYKMGDQETVNLILKIFQKPLRCIKRPQTVSAGFTTIIEVITNQIEVFNLEYKTSFESPYDIKEDERLYGEKCEEFLFGVANHRKSVNPEVLLKLMWLLIDCQQQIPVKWVRFSEARFREIIFSFIHLLSSTNTSEKTKLSGLELLSVLNPTASWCRYWCHTAVGRSLLCTALRKYKHFFIHIIEIILKHMKIKKTNKLPPVRDRVGFSKISPQLADNVSVEPKPFPKNLNVDKRKYRKNYLEKANLNERRKHFGPAPDENAENNFYKNVRLKKPKKLSSEWIVENIPRHIVTEAVFFHSISLVSCLIQFRSGRALFPVQTATRSRLLSAQDLSHSMIEYLENIDFFEWSNTGITYTSAYETEVLEMLEILKRVKAHINSSRMSAERQHFSYMWN